MPRVTSTFEQLVDLVQERSGGRNPITGEKLATPKIIDDLNPPASKNAIQDLERRVGFPLPDDLRQLLSLHDGQNEKGPPAFGLYSFCSINSMLDRYSVHKSTPGDMRMDQSTDERIQPFYWHPGWLPVGYWEQSEMTVDLAPGEKGASGQVFILGQAGFAHHFVAPSLNDFLQVTMKKLKAAPDFVFDY